MICTQIKGGFMCSDDVRIYKYDGWCFEFSKMWGPHPLKKNGELSKRRIGPKFWRMWAKFEKLSGMEKMKFEVLA